MKILLTNHSLTRPGGTETWVKTMYDELSKKHEVHAYAKNTLYPEIPPYDGSYYDLALINHNVCLEALKDADIGRRIYTCHGILPALEQPIRGADVYVAVSEEVQAHLKDLGFDSVIIRNPIDTKHFRPKKPVNQTLQNVLFLSTHQGKALRIVEDACEGLFLNVIGRDKTVQDSLEALNEADLVIGLGRSAYEAMSCNRNVIIYDYNGADGFVTEQTVRQFRKNNCSGRYNSYDLTVESLKELFKRYDSDLKLRPYILDNNSVETIAKRYLCV